MNIPTKHIPFYHPTPRLQWRSFSEGISLLSKILIVLPLRIIGILSLVTSFLLFHLLVLIFLPLLLPSLSRSLPSLFSSLLGLHTRLLFLVCNFSLAVQGLHDPSCRVIVANHTSWLDSLLFCTGRVASAIPSFVVKEALFHLPFLGAWMRMLGCIPALPSSGTSKEIAASLQQRGATVLLFPESTTSNGLALLPFKRGAFHHHHTRVQPCAISYLAHDPWGLSPTWESVPLQYLLFRVLIARRIDIRVRWLAPLEITPDVSSPEAASAVAQLARERLAETLNIPLTDCTPDDKWDYHNYIRSGNIGWQDYANQTNTIKSH